jgi:hypothetical protein
MKMILFYLLELKCNKRMKKKWIKLGFEVLKAIVFAVAGFFSGEIL